MKINSKEKRFLLFVIASLLLFFALSNISATATDSTPQLSLNIFSTSSSSTTGFDKSLCTKGQDFVVQVSPLGCQSVPVRSDLLEQQDVQVYCPLSATQLNPLIKVNSISGISFTGKYPSEINSIAFSPAQAALNTNGQSLNYPVLSNIGYAVIDLKQQPNESAMPNFVTGNLTASISYDATNTFGLGNTNFYLPQLTDSEWQTQYPSYGFLNGKGYLRLDYVQGDKAAISVYDANLNRVSTVVLSTGESSPDLSIPGFDLCSATMTVTLNSFSNPGTLARLDVNGNLLEASEGQTFLGNDCQVRSINDQGLSQDVQITCTTDSGIQTFDLRTSPSVNLNINGKDSPFGLGDFLYQSGNNFVYLGYIGLSNPTQNPSDYLNNIMIVLVSLPNHNEAQLSQDELSSIASLVSQVTPGKLTSVGITNAISKTLLSSLGATNLFLRNLVSGENIKILTYTGKAESAFGGQVEITGFSQPQNSILSNTQTEAYYKNATIDYQSVLNNYASESYPSGSSPTLGEQALYQQMNLARALNQKTDLVNLCHDFEQRYPKATENINFCNDGSLLSSQSISSQYVSINGQAYQISLQGIYEPPSKDYSATIAVQKPDGTTEPVSLIKDQSVSLDSTTGDFIQLNSLTGTSAIITTKPGSAFTSSTHTLNLGIKVKIGNYNFTLQHVNLTQYAQVSITPKSSDVGSKANFTFNISIEKRAIKLSPDKIREKINNTKKSIVQWESLSNSTGKIVDTMNKVCTVTGLALTFKNLLSNLGGSGIARTRVMTDEWNGKCKDLVSQGKYNSLDDCFIKNSNQIDADVSQTVSIMNQQNDQLKQLQDKYTEKKSGLSSVLSQGVVNTDSVLKEYSPTVQSSLSCIGETQITNPSNSKAPAISLSSATSLLDYGTNGKNYNLNQAKDVQLYADILCSSSSSDSLKEMARQQLYTTLSDISTNAKSSAAASKLSSTTSVDQNKIGYLELNKNIKTYTYLGLTVSGLDKAQSTNLLENQKKDLKGNPITSSTPVYLATASNGNNYILVLGDTYGTSLMPVTGVYDTSGNPITDQTQLKQILGQIQFQKVDASSYQNTYKANYGSSVPEVQYFETAPYAGVPAIVPFDLKNGWYAAIKQTEPTIGTSTTTSTSVDSSGRVGSFWLCNVGVNGIEEFNSGIGDDKCQSINLNSQTTYTNFNGLSASETSKLVGEALSAIQQAATARANNPSGLSSVVINNQPIKVGPPATNVPALQCEDFMSPSDCNILFNVCDPVVCPTSRCDFGGAYPVSDVVQTGAIGSTLLCLPNWVLLGGTDYIPVCLPGIQAGIDNWVSVQKNYVQCLQTNLDTGKTVGICNNIWSIYGCNLFWKEAIPFSKIALSKIVETATGQGVSGGGEYLNFQNALSTAQQSVSYITSSYASNSLKAFQTQSTQGVGTGVCQNFVQTVFPSVSNMVSQLSTTDSPPQYSGEFDEITMTTATVPPTSQYQVYYHIYAGKNSGVYYSVYLKNSGSSYYQDSPSTYVVDSGYIVAGNSTAQTKDFTAPSGYTEMCINVNGVENCDFKQVSTNLLANYIQNSYVANQASQDNITTESECTSGTISLASISSLLNLNLQSSVTSALHPSIESLGITRVCATGNPGVSTDPNANSQGSRWINVGYCDNPKIICWLDTQSVSNAIDSPDLAAFLESGGTTTTTLQSSTLSGLNNAYQSLLLNSGNYLTQDQFDSSAKSIENEAGNPNKVIADVNAILKKVFYNNQKAFLLLKRGDAYGSLAIEANTKAQAESSLTCVNLNEYCLSSNSKNLDCCSGQGTCSLSGETPDGINLYECKATSTSTNAGTVVSSSQTAASTTSSTTTSSSQTTSSTGTQTSASGASTSTSAQTSSTSSVTSDTILSLMNSANSANSNYKTIGGKTCDCGTNDQCKSYADSVVSAASKQGENPLLLLAIMMQESQCKVDAIGGTSYGLMQIDSGSVADCKPIGVSTISEVTGESNSDNNIQCGAYILKEKYNSLQKGVIFTCVSPSQTYTGWDAALRGYNGLGCTGDNNYVSDVNTIYNDLQSLANSITSSSSASASSNSGSSASISPASNSPQAITPKSTTGQTPSSSTTAVTQTSPVQDQLQNYDNYKSIFDKYSQLQSKGGNLPVGMSQNDFEALLLSIAQENNWGGTNGNILMGYHPLDSSSQDPDTQVKIVSSILKSAFEGNGQSLDYQTGSSVDYSVCNTQSSSGFVAQAKCILSVYHTGKPNSNGFLGIGWSFLGANTEGNDYANQVMTFWSDWDTYFISQNSGSS